jgi:hypothetical protein
LSRVTFGEGICLMNRLPLILALVALLLQVAMAPELAAQNHSPAPTQPHDSLIVITLVLTNHGSVPMLGRRVNLEPRNVILLDSANVDVQLLSDAVFTLLIMEAVDQQGTRRTNHTVHRASLSQNHPVYPWADEALRRLHGASMVVIRGVGRGRAIEISVPGLRGHSQ